MPKMKSIQDVLADLLLVLSRKEYPKDNVSMRINKKGEVIVFVNLGVL